MVNAPKFVDGLLKSTVCQKKEWPYGDTTTVGYYDPTCIEGMYSCRDICGDKCKQECKISSHPPDCGRGKLTENFLFCPSRDSQDVLLEYVSYGRAEDKLIKEGKKIYKKMDKIKEDMTFDNFLQQFISDFSSYSGHKIVAWLLNNLMNFGPSHYNQNSKNMVCVSDFAQNVKLSKKHEVSEEYSHKTQIAVFGTVSTVMEASKQHKQNKGRKRADKLRVGSSQWLGEG